MFFMLVSCSLFNFVLYLYACFALSVQFRIMSLCIFRSICSISNYEGHPIKNETFFIKTKIMKYND